MITASKVPEGTSILTARPGCAYVADGRRSGFKAGERVQADSTGGTPLMLTIHSLKRCREWWAQSESGAWYVLRPQRPNSVAQMRTMNGAQRLYRRDKLGRFAR